MQRQLILLLVLLVSGPAHAAVSFLHGCENGDCGSTFDRTWSTAVGSITAQSHATRATNGNTGNNWSMQFAPTSGASTYREVTFASTSRLTAKVDFRLQTAPTVERIVPLAAHSGGLRQCFLTIGTDRRLRLYYGDTSLECSQALNNGQTCSTVADCTEANPGEATCSAATFAVGPVMEIGQWYAVAMTQDTALANAADVRCGLFVDCLARGTSTRPQGACLGGANAGAVCANSAGCNSALCVFTNTTSTSLRFGAAGTEASATEFNLDDLVLDPAAVDTALSCSRLADLHPNGEIVGDWDGTVGSSTCTSDFQCVDDTLTTSVHDGDVTAIQASTNATQSVWDLENVTLAGDESVASTMPVSVQCLAAETGDNANNSGKTYQVGIRQTSGAVTMGSNVEVAGLTTDYRSGPLTVLTARPDGAAWTGVSDVNALQMRLLYTGTTGTGFRTRATDCHAEVLLTKALPIVPNALYDWNGDSEKTVCLWGDSKLLDSALEDALISSVNEPDNLLFCANGGRTCGDILGGLSNIANGMTTGNVACEVRRGQAAKCDIAILECGVNDLADVPHLPEEGYCFQWRCSGGSSAGSSCGVNGDCPGGTCAAGPQHASACNLPLGYHNVGWVENRYCRQGADFKAKTMVGTTCVSNSDCAGSPTPGASSIPCDLPAVGQGWCHAGVRDSPECPNGLCVARIEIAAVQRRINQIIDGVQARTGSNAMRLVLGAQYLPADKSCTQAGNGCWACERSGMRNLNSWVKRVATDRGLDWIDFHYYFATSCPNNDPDLCLRDDVHAATAPTPGRTPGTYGDEVLALAIGQCLQGTPNALGHSCTRLKPTPTP